MKKPQLDNKNSGEVQIPKKQLDSSKRMQILSKHISKAIRDANDEIEGDFTISEVIHVLNNNLSAYVSHGLKSEWE
jgi:hypothetical protein